MGRPDELLREAHGIVLDAGWLPGSRNSAVLMDYALHHHEGDFGSIGVEDDDGTRWCCGCWWCECHDPEPCEAEQTLMEFVPWIVGQWPNGPTSRASKGPDDAA